MKIYCIFAVSSPKTYIRNTVVAIFIVTNLVHLCTANDKLGYQNPIGCYTVKRTTVFGEIRGAGSLSFIINFHSMPKTNENASRVNNSNATSTFAHETGTFLTADNIERLKNLFSTPENYAKNLGALWVFRDLLYSTIDKDPNPRENQLFPLWQTVNEVVGSLIRQDIHFDNNGRAYYYQGTTKTFI
ncbi:MAG: hypothetical protein PHX61_00750 [Alphaproteobacteria bacterium]|nr:hypothetical protein [Alphaproteobacteria bacterium]